jgi:hypothetical protein
VSYKSFFHILTFSHQVQKKNSFSHEYAKIYQTEIEKLDFLS